MSLVGTASNAIATSLERRRHLDAGIALIEVIVGISLLALVFLPITNLLIEANHVAAGSQYEVSATSIATGWLDTERQAAASANVAGPDSNCGVFNGDLTTSVATWPINESSCTTLATSVTVNTWPSSTTIGQETFYTTVVGGWCQLSSSSPYSWGTITGTPTNPEYFVAVRTYWGPSATSLTSVVEYSAVPAQSGSWTLPSSSAPWAICPTSLTSNSGTA